MYVIVYKNIKNEYVYCSNNKIIDKTHNSVCVFAELNTHATATLPFRWSSEMFVYVRNIVVRYLLRMRVSFVATGKLRGTLDSTSVGVRTRVRQTQTRISWNINRLPINFNCFIFLYFIVHSNLPQSVHYYLYWIKF